MIQIKTRSAKAQLILDVAEAYQRLYPREFEWIKGELRKLREVSTGTYRAGRNGEMFCRVRVPKHLWLFLQCKDPDFGKDSADMELLCKLIPDISQVYRRDPRVRHQLYVSRELHHAVRRSSQTAST